MKPLRAWPYARVSTTKESQDGSGPRQLDDLGARAQQRSWEVVGKGLDRLSGKSLDRPELRCALDALRENRADVLMVTRLSRLGRNLEEVIATAREIGDWGKHLYVVELGIDTTAGPSTAASRMIFNVLAACDQAVREFNTEAIHSGLARARAKGKKLGRPRTVEFAPAFLAWAVRRRNNGESWRDIAASLATPKSHASLRRAVLAMDKIPPENGAANPAKKAARVAAPGARTESSDSVQRGR